MGNNENKGATLSELMQTSMSKVREMVSLSQRRTA